MKRNAMLVALALTAAACGNDAPTANGGDAEHVLQISGEDSFLNERVTDWVTYSFHIASFDVTAESNGRLSDDETERGEGMVSRHVRLEARDVLWTATDAPELPTSIELQATGWIVSDGKRTPFAVNGGERLEVGSTYLIPVSQRNGEWSLLSPTTAFEIIDDTVEIANTLGSTLSGATAIDGLTLDDVSTILDETPIDPAALPFVDLAPYDRSRAVVNAAG